MPNIVQRRTYQIHLERARGGGSPDRGRVQDASSFRRAAGASPRKWRPAAAISISMECFRCTTVKGAWGFG